MVMDEMNECEGHTEFVLKAGKGYPYIEKIHHGPDGGADQKDKHLPDGHEKPINIGSLSTFPSKHTIKLRIIYDDAFKNSVAANNGPKEL